VVVWKREDLLGNTLAHSVWMRTSHTLARGDDSWVSAAGPDRVDLPNELGLIYGKPVVALQAGVRFAIAWSRQMNVALTQHVVRVRVFENNQAPVPVVVSDLNGDHQEDPQIVIDRRGDIVVAWRRWAADLNSNVIEAMRRLDGDWQPVQPLSDPARLSSRPRLATNGLRLGHASTWVTWAEEGDPMTGRVRAAGAWAAPVPIDTEFTSEPSKIGGLAVNEAGDIVAIWSGLDDARVRARRFE